jgi:(E)-4-hydroxy-3-methylbut-2-enyl-diphosphate synthase
MNPSRKSQKVSIGKVNIGGGESIVIQSMTNTDTGDIAPTVTQIIELSNAGSELVRITVNNEEAARAVPRIREELLKRGCDTPLIGDFHYNGHLLLKKFPECARTLDKYRINPGNEYDFDSMIECALRTGKPVRIGANWGSLDRALLTKMMDENAKSRSPKSDQEVSIQTLVESARSSAKRAEKLGMPSNRMVLSVKTSEVQAVIQAYEALAKQCDYALHLGLTEAGMGIKGVIASSAALAVLLQKGIGDTIRISLTPAPGEPRTREVEACQLLLQTMGLRQFRPLVTSCPGCGRTGSELFQHLTEEVNEYIAERIPVWKRDRRGVENLKVAIMGCVVNGPGEARHADIALSLPGKSEEPMASVFVKGKLFKTLRSGNIGKQFVEILEEFVYTNFL